MLDLDTGLSDKDSVKITIRSAEEQAADLKKMVEDLRKSGALSKDDAKAKAALDKAAKSPDFDAAYRIVNGYVAVVQKKQAALLDTVARQTSSTALSAEDKFTRVVDKLSGDRLVTAWADGHALLELAKVQLRRQAGRARVILSGLPDLGSAALDLHAVDSGAVINGLVETPGTTGGGEATLTNNLPSDTLGALTAFELPDDVTVVDVRGRRWPG